MTVAPRLARTLAILCSVSAFGCGTEITVDGEPIALEVIEEVEFAASLDIDLTQMTKTASGMYYEDLVVGDGAEAVAGTIVDVRYTGWLRSGAQFDTGAFSFTIGSGEVIQGFDEGVRGMLVGGERKLVIPPELGYGGLAIGQIPAGSVLVFAVELLNVS